MEAHVEPEEKVSPLELFFDLVFVCGGVALYLLAHIAFRWRDVGSLNRPRLVAATVCAALIPLATEVDALIALLAVAAVLITLVTFEATAYRDARARVRAMAH